MVKVSHKPLPDSQIADIVGDYQSTVMTYVGGNTRQVYYTDRESFFDEGEQICSCTDTEGHITMVNSAFVHMSGYSKEELIGLPHCILRHRDMPAAAFKEMWSCLASKGRWSGYVKNLRKDGGFYWVHASVFSNYRNGELVGYTSSRLAAPRDKVELYSQKYADWLNKEKNLQTDAA